MTSSAKTQAFRVVWYRARGIGAFGGAERVMAEGLRCLHEMGVRATLLLHETIPPESAPFFATCPSDIMVAPAVSAGEPTSYFTLKRLTQSLRRIRNYRDILAKLAPDLIIANELNDCRLLWLYSLCGILRTPPVVTFVHGSPFQFDDDVTKYALVFRRHLKDIRDADPVYRQVIPLESPAMALRDRLKLEFECFGLWMAARMSKLILVGTEKNRQEGMLFYGVRNVIALPPGGFSDAILHEETPSTAVDNGGPILLSICRLIRKKRVDILLRGFHGFLSKHPNSSAILVIGGTGPAEDALRGLAKELGIDKKVRFIGFVTDDDLMGWYRKCDVFLSADNADYDLTVMMALPAGKKIVVSQQYSIPESLQSLRRFFFVADPNPDGFAIATEKALIAPALDMDASDAVELRALTWESYFKNLISLCRRLISNEGRGQPGPAQVELRRPNVS